jgi:hypothetical protein
VIFLSHCGKSNRSIRGLSSSSSLSDLWFWIVESRLLLVAGSVVLSSRKKRRKRRESLLGTIFLSSLVGSSSAPAAIWMDSMCAGVGLQVDSSEL